MTWAQFKAGVLLAYNPGGDATKMGYAAVAAYVKALICREVDGDLLLSKSYMNTYTDLKAKLIGSTVPVYATTQPEVLIRLTVDASRASIATYINEAIQEAIDDINATTALFEKYVTEAAYDIQRHVVCYTTGNVSTIETSTFTPAQPYGYVTRLNNYVAANTINTVELYLARYAQALAAQAYAVDDTVQSNQRIYKCVTAGTVAVVGDGLTSTDGVEETLGTAGFIFTYNRDYNQCTPIKWASRMQLIDNRPVDGNGPWYSISPRGDEIWVYPALDSEDYMLQMMWDGIKVTFVDADTVTFDEKCFVAASEFVRGMIQKNLVGDERAASMAMATYQGMLKRLWLDCNDRTNSIL